MLSPKLDRAQLKHNHKKFHLKTHDNPIKRLIKKFVKHRNKNTTINIATKKQEYRLRLKSPLTVYEAKTYSLTKRHNKVLQLILT